MKLTAPLTVYLPDTRGVVVSPYGKGNLKIGPDVFTYSRVAGRYELLGTCPGSSEECEAVCYAKRITGVVKEQYVQNSRTAQVPPIPAECRLLRIHISGDFDRPLYIEAWIRRLQQRPDVTAWGYTRSWRVAELLPHLEDLRALPNMQLFASMDQSVQELPPAGWRIAWIDGDPRCHVALTSRIGHNRVTVHDPKPNGIGYVCPEQTGRKVNCQECRYCFDGQKHDVVFLKH